MVRLPRQVAECLTKLPENVSLENFPFLYSSYCSVSQHSSMVVSRLNQYTVHQRLDGGGVDFSSKTTALITWEIQYFSFLGALTNLSFFGTPAVQLLVYSDFHNKKR